MEHVEIVLEGPGKNAINTALMITLKARLQAAGARPVLLTGAGDSFSAGLDLKELTQLDPVGMRAFLERLEDLVLTIFRHPAPIVAAVNGHAIAGGAVLALACDLTVATRNPRTRIGLNEVALGLRFPPATLEVVRFRLPRQHEAEVLLGALLHDPERARHLGLVDELAEDPVAMARRHLLAFSRHPLGAYAASKADLRAGIGDISPDQARRFADEVVPTWTSPEVSARIRAALAPRPQA